MGHAYGGRDNLILQTPGRHQVIKACPEWRPNGAPNGAPVAGKMFVASSKYSNSDRNRDLSEYTAWMSATEFQYEFDNQMSLRRYPPKVEGRNNNGRSEYRATFEPFPEGAFYYWTHHGIDKSFYDRKYSELNRQRYTLKSLQTFIDRNGIERYQATWVRYH